MNKYSEIQSFSIGAFDYKLVLHPAGGVSLLLVDGFVPGIGDLRKAYEEYDPFQKWEDYDPDSFALTGDEDFNVPVFALTRECVNRIAGWANRVRPGYFILSPATDRKERVYDRLAKIIARKVKGYSHHKIGKSNYFYRM
jgi:hypothetical protein